MDAEVVEAVDVGGEEAMQQEEGVDGIKQPAQTNKKSQCNKNNKNNNYNTNWHSPTVAASNRIFNKIKKTPIQHLTTTVRPKHGLPTIITTDKSSNTPA